MQLLSKHKTDRIDSINIVMFGICYWDELNRVLPPEETYRELKLLARQYYQSTSMLVKAKINFGVLCDQVMPGVHNIIHEYRGTQKITGIVKRYLHFDNILKMSKNRFKTDYCKWAQKQGYRNCEQTAEKLYVAAQNGIPVLPNSLSTTIVITEAIRTT